jgi:Protein of unknown function (DUF4242)
MAEFVVEFYASRSDTADVKRRAQRARLAADALTREGKPVRFVRSIYVPEDETCFLLYEATSCDAVREAAARADLSFQRVARALAS